MTAQLMADRSSTIVRLLRRNATRNLSKILESMRTEDIAAVFRRVVAGRWKQLFELVQPLERRAELLSELDPEIQEPFLQQFANAELAQLMRAMSSDDAADLLHLLPEERASAIMAMVKPDDDLSEAVELMRYDPETAGGIMVPLNFAVPAAMTVGEAILELQSQSEQLEMVFYLYVVNDHGHLVGVCSLRDLVTTPPEIQLADIMESNVIRVATDTDQEEVARVVARYNLLAVPVVDETNHLVGIVTVDDIIDVIREEATEDMLKMAGVAEDFDVSERKAVWSSARARIPWLGAAFLGGLGGIFIISSFQAAIETIAVLAAFLPITVGMGGNVGTQSATIVVRGLALGRIEVGRLWAVVRRESLVGIACGVVYGLALGLIVLVFFGSQQSPVRLALSVGCSITAAMGIAATVGGTMPLIFQRLNIDPAVATGPFVTTSVDILGILAYFIIATLLLGL
jgi:magnesium transporter